MGTVHLQVDFSKAPGRSPRAEEDEVRFGGLRCSNIVSMSKKVRRFSSGTRNPQVFLLTKMNCWLPTPEAIRLPFGGVFPNFLKVNSLFKQVVFVTFTKHVSIIRNSRIWWRLKLMEIGRLPFRGGEPAVGGSIRTTTWGYAILLRCFAQPFGVLPTGGKHELYHSKSCIHIYI